MGHGNRHPRATPAALDSTQAAGALLLSLAARAFMKRRAFVAIAGAGMIGAIVDSLLGASLQTLRWCERCERATERTTHECGAQTTLVRGLPGFGNDWVI